MRELVFAAMEGKLTHIDSQGRAQMVDVGDKAPSDRRARAAAVVRMSPSTAAAVVAGDLPKGDVLAVARIAAIQAAKRTADLIPLAHTLPLSALDVQIDIDTDNGTALITSEARTQARTGVEMEALVAATVGALAIYDMVKALERGVTVESVRLLEKTGGKEDWHGSPG